MFVTHLSISWLPGQHQIFSVHDVLDPRCQVPSARFLIRMFEEIGADDSALT